MFQLLAVLHSTLQSRLTSNEQDIFSVEKCAVATHGMYTVEDIEAIGSVQYWSVCHGR